MKPSLFLSALFLLISGMLTGQAPPNAPAQVIRRGDSLWINYNGRNLLAGSISGTTAAIRVRDSWQRDGDKVHHLIAINSANNSRFALRARVQTGAQAFACASEPRDRGLAIVRHSAGASQNLLNNAIYDRQGDWLLSVDPFYARVQIKPGADGAFALEANSWEIVLRFRPRYYQQHRDLPYFEPWTYDIWPKPITGWCSWFAYFSQVDEQKVKRTADVLGQKLRPFGLEYLQIDDGYQQTPIGMPQGWLQPNEKFPGGMASLASYIRERGLKPGIWTNVSFADSAAAYQNRNLFVKDGSQLANGNWIGYVMDGSNPATIEQLIKPVYAGFKDMGWQYFKLDALRHLRYEGYNTFPAHIEQKKANRVEAFRNVVKAVRQTIGPDNFLLGCWGIRPELTGLIDGCRIGNDGYSFAGLAQFNSYNNVVWLNDPDHIELSEAEAFRSCTATSLTGSLFMLTDKPEVYEGRLIEAARRTIPVLYTRPGQVYDVDPSRSARIGLADVEMSGSGPRPFDAGTGTITGLFQLDVHKSFDNWTVLGRLDERDPMIPFAELGLAPDREYLVFEFWTKTYRGAFQGSFAPGPIDPAYRCQVFCIRERQDHPQLLATNRHISCGGLELSQLQWDGKALSGQSELVPGDDYVLYLHEPAHARFLGLTCTGAEVADNRKQGVIRMVTLRSTAGGVANWVVAYD